MPGKKIKINQNSYSKNATPADNQSAIAILSSIIKSLPGNIYWKDKDGKYLGCNDYALDMAGIKSIVGKTDFDMPWLEPKKYAIMT